MSELDLTSESHLGFATFSLPDLALGLLMGGAKHGYQLYQDYERLFRPIWTVGRSKFYAALATLCEEGYLDAQVELQMDRPPRKIYSLTGTGEARFLDWVYRPVLSVRAIRVEFLAKLRFLTLLSLPNPERLCDAQITVCQQALAAWEDNAEQSDAFTQMLYTFRHGQVHAVIDSNTVLVKQTT